jgi:hypothetical protein
LKNRKKGKFTRESFLTKNPEFESNIIGIKDEFMKT